MCSLYFENTMVYSTEAAAGLTRKAVQDFRNKFKNASGTWWQKKKMEMSQRQYWMKRLPLIGWLSNYTTSFFISDLIAGLTVGLTVIPQGMACAVVAGLPPQYGLYSAFIPCFVYMFLGTSKDITIGPTAISAMLVKPYAMRYGPLATTLVCFLSGCLITILGILQLGFVVDFISLPVLEGFMSAGAISIASSQVAPLLGFKSSTGSTFIDYWGNVGQRITQTTIWDPVLGFICIIFLTILKYLSMCCKSRQRTTAEKAWGGFLKYLSLGRNALVVLLSSAAIAIAMYYLNKAPVAITGPVKEGFPTVQVPTFKMTYKNQTLSFSETLAELSPATIIPFVLILESIAIAKAFAKGKAIDATQELMAVGLSNIIGSFFQSFPVTGSFTRTAVNNASGVKTPVGGIYTAALVLLCLGFLTTYLKYIPKPTLAALIICAVLSMVEIHDVTKKLWNSKKVDLIPLYATFIGCLCLGMDWGIVVGIAVNMLFILYEAARPKLKVQLLKVLAHEVLLVSPDRSITYPAAEYVKDVITRACENSQEGLLVVVDGRSISYIDSTAVKPIVFWNWNRKIITLFIGFDAKGQECFLDAETLEQLIPATKSPENKEGPDGLEMTAASA
ncbi:UNVERIFIED_CONTAM: hypothetical protein B566_EDAN018189 [Ephemera danica]|nr:hypothetical protein B566_EDAN018189 [Ephemera danica]